MRARASGEASAGRAVRRVVQVLIAAFAVLLTLSAGSAVAAASEEGESAIVGRFSVEDPESGERVGVAGVEVSVEGVGSVTSDEEGNFRIVVPEPGEYIVGVVVETLPEGIGLRDPEVTSRTVLAEPDKDKQVLFALIGDGAEASSGSAGISVRRVAQLTVEGLKEGLYLAMAAIGLSLIFGTTGLTNFAHAELVTWGMLSTYFFNVYGLAGMIGFLAPLPGPLGGGVNLVIAAVFGALTGAVVGYLINRFMFRGARRAGVSLLAQMLMTIGLSILFRYLLLYIFGGSPRTFAQFTAQRALSIGPVEVTAKDLIAMGLSVVILVGVGLYLQRTQMGKAMRAVADNRDLAESTGIDVERVISTVWLSGAGLAALAGVFYGLTVIRWDFGFKILLLIFAAVVLGGLGTAFGAFMGALVVGLSITLSTLVIDAELKNMVALLVLVVILMVRPQGLFGRAERIG